MTENASATRGLLIGVVGEGKNLAGRGLDGVGRYSLIKLRAHWLGPAWTTTMKLDWKGEVMNKRKNRTKLV